jgi:recombination protein RecT
MPSSRTAARARAPQKPKEETAIVVFDAAAQKEKAESLINALDARRDQMIAFLGSDEKTAGRFLTVAIDAIVRNPEILQADLLSLVASVRHAAIMGLEPTSIMGEGAIVSYRDSGQGGKKIAQFQPMVRGLQKLARNSGEIMSIGVDIVHRNDHFVYRSGSDPIVDHEPYITGFTGPDDPGDIVGAYAFVKLRSGELIPMFMSTDDILKRRKFSKSFQNSGEKSIWGQWPEEMMKKTVLRRLLVERVPLSARTATALALDGEIDSTAGDPGKAEARALLGSRTRARLASGIIDDLGEKAPDAAQDAPQAPEQPEVAVGAATAEEMAHEPSTAREICGKPGMSDGVFCTNEPHKDGLHFSKVTEETWL